jgi:mercuric ion binding protein
MCRSSRIVLCVSLFLSTLPGTTVALAEKPMRQYAIRADGMACAYCAYGIEKKFKNIKGVRGVDFDLQEGLVKVSMDCSAALGEDTVRKLLAESGFTFRSLKEDGLSCENK